LAPIVASVPSQILIQEYQRATANYASAHAPEFLGKLPSENRTNTRSWKSGIWG
jgi:hypothetical protein